MRAAQLTAPETIELAEVAEPKATEGLAVLESEIMGVCGTDVKVLRGTIPVSMPRIMGHELVGRVVATPDPDVIPEGTRVLVDPSLACGTCHQCLHRRPHLCSRGGLMGREIDGVFAELVAVDPARLLPMPESIEDREAGLIQVLGTCVHGLRTVDVFPGDVAVVLGLGVAGQLMVQLLSQRGATVIGITRSEEKRQLAARHGATAVAAPGDAEEVIGDLTSGIGPSLVVEAVGTEATLSQAIEWAGTAADVVLFGTLTGGQKGLPYYQLYYKELTLWNPRAALLEDYARAIQLVGDGLLDVGEIVTDVVPLDEIEEAFRLVDDPASLKVLVDPNDGP